MLSVRHVSLRRPWLAAKFGSRGDIPCSTRTSPAYARPFGKGYVFGNGRTAVGRRNDALSDHRCAPARESARRTARRGLGSDVHGIQPSCRAGSCLLYTSGHDAWAAVELEDADDVRVLAGVMERPDLVPSTFDDALRLAPQVEEALGSWAMSRTPMQVSIILQHAGLAVAPVQSTEDLWRDPQLRARGAFVEIDHPDIGLLEQPQSPDRMTLTPGHVRGRSRRLGEDTFAAVSYTHLFVANDELRAAARGHLAVPQRLRRHRRAFGPSLGGIREVARQPRRTSGPDVFGPSNACCAF